MFKFLIVILFFLIITNELSSETYGLKDPYYPQHPSGELRLNYYYDRSGRWVKFSDWIPNHQKKFQPLFLEDFYLLYGLKIGYNVPELKEAIYYLYLALSSKFRHPRNALCKIQNEEEYHKYRLLMFMEIHLLLTRMYLRLGSLYDKRHLYFHDLDVADDLEVSFLIARTYYNEALKFWQKAKEYAENASAYVFTLDLGLIETHRYEIIHKQLDFERIIKRHLNRVETKLEIIAQFLNQEGRPRPIKQKMLDEVKGMYDQDFSYEPLTEPTLNPHWKEEPFFPDE
ncbi:MAG: hypothetical protein NZ853_04810 [Leptospiraceae bacterium]|nr:hypothetical protein [Leptospiraceae bacterium]MDW7975907.1 hypothetical protein [Leptospiraceae bacterium]